MKILAFSDIHCDLDACAALVRSGADADLVIGAGDFAENHEGLAETMAALESLAAKAIYVPGNNETTLALRATTSAQVLHGENVLVNGIRIFGIGCAIPPLPPLPWVSHDLTETEAQTILATCESADILVSHSPPKGVVDRHAEVGSIGSVSVLAAIKRLQPRHVFCGHIHDCWGQSAQIDASQVTNLGPTVNWFEI